MGDCVLEGGVPGGSFREADGSGEDWQ